MLGRAAERTDTILGSRAASIDERWYDEGTARIREPVRTARAGSIVLRVVARPEGFEPPTY